MDIPLSQLLLPPVNDPLDCPRIDPAPNNPKVSEVAAKRLSSPVPPQKRPRSLSENDKYTIQRRANNFGLSRNPQNSSEELVNRIPPVRADVRDGIPKSFKNGTDSSSDSCNET